MNCLAAQSIDLPALASRTNHLPIGPNLFNPAAATINSYVQAATGLLQPYQGAAASDYIPCNSGGLMATQVPMPQPGADNGIAFYGSGPTYPYISGSTAAISAGGSFTCPATAAFVRFTLLATDVPAEMIVSGVSLPQSYQGFGTYPPNVIDAKIAAVSGSSGTAQLGLVQAGDNFVLSNLGLSATPNLLNPASLLTGLYNTAGNLDTHNGVAYATAFFFCLAGSTVTANQTPYDGRTTGYLPLTFFDANGNFLSGLSTLPAAGTPIACPANAARGGFALGGASGVPAQLATTLTIVSGTTAAATPIAFGYSPPKPLAGLNCGVLGDSLTTYNEFQPIITARTGCKFIYQDARPGRIFATAVSPYPGAFECYGAHLGQPLSAFGTYTTAVTATDPQGNYCSGYGEISTIGNTLAQNLANVDVLFLRLGTNDQGFPLGASGDSVSTDTQYGHIRWVIETLLTAKPTLRLLIVSPELNGFGNAMQIQQTVTAEQTIAATYAAPFLNLYTTSGNNPFTASTYTRDGTHPTDWAFQNVDGPLLADFLLQNR